MPESFGTSSNGETIFPSSLSCPWKTVLADVRTAADDPTPTVDPTSLPASRIVPRTGHEGTLMILRMGYTGTRPTTAPIIAVFGAFDGQDDSWTRLRNKNNDLAITVDGSATLDLVIGSNKYTNPDNELHVLDTLGMSRFQFAIETAATDATTAWIQAMVI